MTVSRNTLVVCITVAVTLGVIAGYFAGAQSQSSGQPRPTPLSAEASWEAIRDRIRSAFHLDIPLAPSPQEAYSSQVFIGDRNNLLPASFLERGGTIRHAVGRLIVVNNGKPRGSVPCAGTGFLIADGWMLTCHHVWKKRWGNPGEEVFLELYNNTDQPVRFDVDPSRSTVEDAKLDFALVPVRTLTDNEHRIFKPIGIFNTGPAPALYDPMNIIQHPNCGSTQVVLQDNRALAFAAPHLYYEADTDDRSSGSPVFDNGWLLVAMHRHSREVKDDVGRKRTLNEGILMYQILQAIQEQNPDLLEKLKTLSR